MPEHEIKTMKLYHHVERIERRLRGLGYSNQRDERVDPERLGTMDSLHFFGDEPIQRILQLINGGKDTSVDPIDNTSAAKKVLDIGTGYGGTARLLAHRSGCHVDALELQPDLSAAGQHLTHRCGLDALITHKTGDFLQLSVAQGEYDVVVGLLCFLHIGNWPQLFQRCFDSLKAGGVMYVEDFFQRGQAFTDQDTAILKNDIYCSTLCTREQLMALLEKCGFEEIDFQDVTPKWTPYVVSRHIAYHTELENHIAHDGRSVVEALDHFYASVATVFQAGNLGGFTLVVRKPISKAVAA